MLGFGMLFFSSALLHLVTFGAFWGAELKNIQTPSFLELDFHTMHCKAYIV